MKITAMHSLLAGGFVAACAQVSHTGRDAPAPARVPAHAQVITRLAQIDYGREARFVSCAVAECPTVTQKALAIVADPLRPTAIETPPPSPEPAAPQTKPELLTLEFGSGSAALSAESQAKLLAALPAAKRAARIVIRGRTDEVGAKDVNNQLALRRAIAVRNVLRQRLGGAQGDIVVEAKGSCCYLAGNDSPQGRARNRRVEIEFKVNGEVS